MKRETEDRVLLSSLIPDAACIPGIRLGSEARRLIDILSHRLAVPGCEPLETLLFLTRAFSAFCQDGILFRSPVRFCPVLSTSGLWRQSAY